MQKCIYCHTNIAAQADFCYHCNRPQAIKPIRIPTYPKPKPLYPNFLLITISITTLLAILLTIILLNH